MAAPLLAKAVGGDAFLGFISAVAFATILAVVAGLTLAGAATLSHDLWVNVMRHGAASEQEQLRVARASTVVLGILAILLNGLGIHKFYLGYQTEGIIMLVAWVLGLIFTCGIASMVVSVIGIIEGILYLTKSDEEFVRTYIQNKKAWF